MVVRLRAWVAVLTAVVLGCSLLTGCGDDRSGGGQKTVTMWTHPVIIESAKNREFWKRTIARFEERHPDIKVRVITQPWANRDATLSAAILAGKGPDLAYLIPDQVGRYYDQDVLEPVADYLPKETMADYRANALDAVSMDAEPYVAPMLMSVLAGSCDKRVLKATGLRPPKTWQDLLDMAPKLKRAGYYATHYQADLEAALNMNFYQFLWQAGGSVFSPDGRSLVLDSPQGVRALTYLKKLADRGYVDRAGLTEGFQPDQSAIASGKVACTYTMGPNEVEAAQGGDENIEVVPPLTDAKQAPYGTVGGYAVFRDAPHPDAVRAWLTYLTSRTVMTDYDRESSYYSPRKSVGTLYDDGSVLGAAEKYLDLAVTGEPNRRFREVSQVISQQVQAALLGEMSPEHALAGAADQAAPILRN